MIRSLCLFILSAGTAFADPVGITKDTMSVVVETAKGPVEISRIQDTENTIDAGWTLTSRACPPFCIQPMTPAEGVTTIDSSGVGELVSAFTTVTNRGGKLKLVNLPPKVNDILQITQLITVFEVYDTEDEALASF